MADVFQEIWHWIGEAALVFISLAIYFVPSFLRQWRNFVYTPLYFAFYPLSHVKRDVVYKYVGSTYFPPLLEDEDEAEKLKKKTILVVSVSSILDTVIIPVCIAFLWSLYLSEVQFIIALTLLLCIQGSRFLVSFFTLWKHLYGTVTFRGWLAAGYIVALILIALAMLETHRWILASLAHGSYMQLFWNVADLLWSLIPMAIVSALITAIINLILFDKKIRQRNFHGRQTSTNKQGIATQRSDTKRPKRTNKK